ncbi:MAG: pyrimidine dimer DNA glycosylase/endonuclease V [candidate division SR1 bacterium]|nr:pyrimidine dimer DNA glycosylase/endonuclease V [candidate division SR1 bacterium]
MRLRSIHPSYLDRQGLLAVRREGLLAKKVLAGKTKGYTQHPQLERFKVQKNSAQYIDAYLYHIYEEAKKRGYVFDQSKINHVKVQSKISITEGQIIYEYQRLQSKLQTRTPDKHKQNQKEKSIQPHPLFMQISGPIASREKI